MKRELKSTIGWAVIKKGEITIDAFRWLNICSEEKRAKEIAGPRWGKVIKVVIEEVKE